MDEIVKEIKKIFPKKIIKGFLIFLAISWSIEISYWLLNFMFWKTVTEVDIFGVVIKRDLNNCG